MATSLTNVEICSLKPGPERREIPDGNGLYCILQPTGARSFGLRYRRRDGRRVKLTLGAYFSGDVKDAPEPRIGGPLTIEGARVLATKAKREIEKGRDPAGEKREAKREAQEKRRQATAAAFGEHILKRICRMSEDDHGVTGDLSKKFTGPERLLMLQRWIYPEIGDRPISENRRKGLVRMLDQWEDRSGRVATDRALALLSLIMKRRKKKK